MVNLPKYVDINGTTYEQLNFLEEDNDGEVIENRPEDKQCNTKT